MQAQLKKLSEIYGFSVEDAMEKLKGKVGKVGKKGEEVKEELNFMLPYRGELDEELCQAVQPTFGLYLQCPKKITDANTKLCGGCLKKLEKNGTGAPDNGWMVDRQKTDVYEFKTPSGKKAIHYLKVVEKRGWDLEEIKAYISANSLEVSDKHFEVLKAPAKSKGTPKAKATTAEGKIEKLTIANLQEHAAATAEELSENEYDTVSEMPSLPKKAKGKAKAIEDDVSTVAESVQPAKAKAKAKAKAIEKPKEAAEAPKAKAKAIEKPKEAAEAPKAKAKAKAKAIEKPKEEEEDEIKCIEYVVDGVTLYLHEATGILYDEEGNEKGKK
jgi:hypothetical protein